MVIHMKCVYAFYPSTCRSTAWPAVVRNASDNSVGPAQGITDKKKTPVRQSKHLLIQALKKTLPYTTHDMRDEKESRDRGSRWRAEHTLASHLTLECKEPCAFLSS